MCCRRPFLSEGIHNRLCDSCKKGVKVGGIAVPEFGYGGPGGGT